MARKEVSRFFKGDVTFAGTTLTFLVEVKVKSGAAQSFLLDMGEAKLGNVARAFWKITWSSEHALKIENVRLSTAVATRKAEPINYKGAWIL